MSRKLICVLLVLVMLVSVVSPALATSTEQNLTCPSCSKLTTGNSKVAVVEINGIEKNEILAKALKNKDVKKIANMLTRKGYMLDLLKVRVYEILLSDGNKVMYTLIPVKTYNSNIKSGIAVIKSEKGVKIFGWIAEIINDKTTKLILYKIEDNKLVTYSMLTKSKQIITLSDTCSHECSSDSDCGPMEQCDTYVYSCDWGCLYSCCGTDCWVPCLIDKVLCAICITTICPFHCGDKCCTFGTRCESFHR